MSGIGIHDIAIANRPPRARARRPGRAPRRRPGQVPRRHRQDAFSVPAPDEDIVTMGAAAAKEVIDRHGVEGIRTVLFATESGVDQSKAAGVYVHGLLGLPHNVRVVELKQACYGGTAAVQLALGIIARAPHERVLVIAADVARYDVDTAAEPTQGAGAAAILVSADPDLVEIEPAAGVLHRRRRRLLAAERPVDRARRRPAVGERLRRRVRRGLGRPGRAGRPGVRGHRAVRAPPAVHEDGAQGAPEAHAARRGALRRVRARGGLHYNKQTATPTPRRSGSASRRSSTSTTTWRGADRPLQLRLGQRRGAHHRHRPARPPRPPSPGPRARPARRPRAADRRRLPRAARRRCATSVDVERPRSPPRRTGSPGCAAVPGTTRRPVGTERPAAARRGRGRTGGAWRGRHAPPVRRSVGSRPPARCKKDPHGQLIYDGEVLDLRVDDRALTHLQIVIVNMLRRDHRFVFSWKDDVLHGDGRSSIWLHPNVSLRFTFGGSRVPRHQPQLARGPVRRGDVGSGARADAGAAGHEHGRRLGVVPGRGAGRRAVLQRRRHRVARGGARVNGYPGPGSSP